MFDEEQMAVSRRTIGSDECRSMMEGQGGLVNDLVGQVIEDGGLRGTSQERF